MASFSFSRQSQPASFSQRSNGALFDRIPRGMGSSAASDPLTPLRTMAERVGKEVEKFAEKVDNWHVYGNESSRAKYQNTVELVDHFKDVAETQVKELKKAHATKNKQQLGDSVRRRIQYMAEASGADGQTGPTQPSLPLGSSLSPPQDLESRDLQDLRQWQAELATWELVRIMIAQHYPKPDANPKADKQRRLAQAGGNKRYSPNSDIWDRFILEDDKAKEKDLVLRWLEQTARDERSEVESITAELEKQSGKGAHTWTSGWLDTRGQIKQAKRLEGADQPLKPSDIHIKTSDRTQDLVTQLDPDSPARQKRGLEPSDEYYERALWMVCYEMLRRGLPWSEICEWAQERNEAWRGVSVGASFEAHPNGGPNLAGPTVGYLFRRMCFYAARGARTPYEGAVYGLLSGDLKQVQNACQSWDDHLHAHYNALLLSRFDSYLQKNHPHRVNQKLAQKFVFQDAVSNIGDWDGASRKVIDVLKQQKPTAAESTQPIKLIQGALIAETLDELLLKVGTALADMLKDDQRPVNLMLHPDSDVTDPGPHPVGEERRYTAEDYYQDVPKDAHALRILVHVFIMFKNGLNTLDSEQLPIWIAMDNVVVAYIEMLRITQRISVIPIYAAQLAPERAAHCLARVIPDIKNSEEQRKTVDLFNQYGIDIVEVVAQAFTFAFGNSGFTHFAKGGYTVITKPINRFEILGPTDAHNAGLWPGYRIKREFAGEVVEPKEEAIIESLQWYHYISDDYKQTFEHLRNALTIFLLNGCFGAAEKIVKELSVESLSLSRTEALCGYPFDFTQEGTEEQDETLLHEHRKSLTGAALRSAIKHDALPNAEKHAAIVERLREKSSAYCDLQNIVRILVLFREWRHEEDELIKLKDQTRQSQDGANKKKADMSHIKELLESIEVVFMSLMSSFAAFAREQPKEQSADSWNLKCAYMPDIVLGYISVLQTAALFLQRDSAISSAVKAMEVANVVADEDNAWLQRVFVRTGRMSELVEALAMVSKAMLQLNEHEPKKSATKKRGSKGETLRIWDLKARDRV